MVLFLFSFSSFLFCFFHLPSPLSTRHSTLFSDRSIVLLRKRRIVEPVDDPTGGPPLKREAVKREKVESQVKREREEEEGKGKQVREASSKDLLFSFLFVERNLGKEIPPLGGTLAKKAVMQGAVKTDQRSAREEGDAPIKSEKGVKIEAAGAKSVKIEAVGEKGVKIEEKHVKIEAGQVVLPRAPTVVFSRMSGIQRWKNGVFLFVNLGLPDAKYNNGFSAKGKYFDWFAQTSQTIETPVIADMIHRKCSVILFCRAARERLAAAAASAKAPPSPSPSAAPVKREKEGNVKSESAFESDLPEGYVDFGRVECVSYDDKKSPVKLVFALLDYGVLARTSSLFHSLLGITPESTLE